MTFDYARFYSDLNTVRLERELSWYQIWRQTSIHVPTSGVLKAAIASGQPMRQVAIEELARWSGLSLENYKMLNFGEAVLLLQQQAGVSSENLAEISEAILRMAEETSKP